MLCNGRLLSCAGHRVHSNTYTSLLTTHTNAVTMLRHPWYRLQSDYNYIRSKPKTTHLSPEINISHMLSVVGTSYSGVWDAESDSDHQSGTSNSDSSSSNDAATPPVGWEILQYAQYPGVSNCMVKMLNGYQCGADWNDVLRVSNMQGSELLNNAKQALQAMLFVGKLCGMYTLYRIYIIYHMQHTLYEKTIIQHILYI